MMYVLFACAVTCRRLAGLFLGAWCMLYGAYTSFCLYGCVEGIRGRWDRERGTTRRMAVECDLSAYVRTHAVNYIAGLRCSARDGRTSVTQLWTRDVLSPKRSQPIIQKSVSRHPIPSYPLHPPMRNVLTWQMSSGLRNRPLLVPRGRLMSQHTLTSRWRTDGWYESRVHSSMPTYWWSSDDA